MEKMTFKQYLESKEQLLKAIANTPTSIIEYEVKKYCNISVGDNEDEKESISLKPKNTLVVEWRYDDVYNPTPTSIRFKGVKNLEEGDELPTFWTGKKLNTWLSRHTTTKDR